MSKFVVRVDDKYVKHTSRFGPFYGSMVLTDNEQEARLFTRETDARRLVGTIRMRLNSYEHERRKFPNVQSITYEEAAWLK